MQPCVLVSILAAHGHTWNRPQLFHIWNRPQLQWQQCKQRCQSPVWVHAQTSVSARGGAMPATARTRARAAPIGRACGHRALRGRCCLSPRLGRPSPPITPRPACHVCVRLYGGSSTCMLMRTHTRTHARTQAHTSTHMNTYKRTQTRMQAPRHTQHNIATLVLRMRVPQ